MALKAHAKRAFHLSRHGFGSRSIRDFLKSEGIEIRRYLTPKLMNESGLISKQPGVHKDKKATTEHVGISNRLNREFTVEQPNQIWCGDITDIWTGNRWSYLAVLMGLYARKVVGWAMSNHSDTELTMKALDDAWSRLGRRDVPLRPGLSVHQSVRSVSESGVTDWFKA